MVSRVREFIVKLADAAMEVRAAGQADIHFTDLADVYFKVPVPNETYEGVRVRLIDVRSELERREVATMLVSRFYFGIDAEMPRGIPRPKRRVLIGGMDADTARRCLPGGTNKPTHGLYWPMSEDDPIERAALEWVISQESSKLLKLNGRMSEAERSGRLLRSTIRALVAKAVPGSLHMRLHDASLTGQLLLSPGDEDEEEADVEL